MNLRKSAIFTILALLLVFTTILAPMPDWLTNINITGSGGQLGLQRATAADLSPVTIATSTSNSSVLYPYQRQVVYAKSNFWTLFSNGTNLVIYRSLDGATWSSAATVKSSVSNGWSASLWFDSDNICVAYASGVSNTALQYIQYTPEDDGTLTAQTAWQTAKAADAGLTYSKPSVCKDSNGYPIVGYISENVTGERAFVTKANQNNGTWSSDNFNTIVSDNTDYIWYAAVVPMTSGDFMALYARDTYYLYSRVYDYSSLSFLSENSTDSALEKGYAFSAVSTSDGTVHLVYEYADDDIIYTYFEPGAADWSVEEDLYVGSSATKAPVLSKTLDDNLYCFWMGDNVTDHIFKASRTSGVWSTDNMDWLAESGITDNASISCAYEQTTTDYIPVVWLTGSSPYNVRFAALERDLEPWLTGHESRQSLSVAAAVPAAKTLTYQAASKDTFLNQFAPTTQQSAVGYLSIRTNAAAKHRSILEFDISLPAGATSISATLTMKWYYHSTNDPAGQQIDIWKLKNTVSTWVENEATWNVYKTGSNWPSGAGGFADCDTDGTPAAGVQSLPAAEGVDVTWDISEIVQDAYTNESNTVRLLVKFNTEDGTDYIARFYDAENATLGNRPKLAVTYTPASGDTLDDKVNINVYKGSKTVEDGTWTVASETYNHQIAFTIKVFSELTANTYPIRVVVDTAKLVTGGFTTSTNAMAKRLEWAESDGSNPMKYWATESTSAGTTTIKNWNTTGTVFYITPQTTLSANTTYTYYLYVDPDIGDASANYSGPSMVGASGFFEHFDEASANLTEFLADYDGDPNNDWNEDSEATYDPTVVVANSVCTVTNNSAAHWMGIATTFTMEDFRMLIGWQSKPGNGAVAGMVDAGGFHAATGIDAIYAGGAADEVGYYKNANRSTPTASYDIPLWTTDGPFITEMVKYEDLYRWYMIRDDPGGEPDTASKTLWEEIRDASCTDVAHKVFIASYANTVAAAVDWIAVMAEVDEPPLITFPDVTYDAVGTVFCNDQFSSSQDWWDELAFTESDGTTEIYWCKDDLAQLTRQPGDAIRVTVNLGAAITSATSVYCYFDQPLCAGAGTYQDASEVYGADESYRWQAFSSDTEPDDFTEKTGSWAALAVADPYFSKAPVGNVGGAAGRCWARFHNVVKWDTDSYYHITNIAAWEFALIYWPAPYGNAYISHSTSPEEPPDVGYVLAPFEHNTNPGWWPMGAYVDSGILYVSWVNGAVGTQITWTATPDDPTSWTVNPNGPFLVGVSNTTGAGALMKIGATWYVPYIDSDSKGQIVSTSDAPEDWDGDSFGAATELWGPAAGHREDDQVVYDSVNGVWYWSYCGLGVLYYRTLTESVDPEVVFPGAGEWSAEQTPTLDGTVPWDAAVRRNSPRLLENDDGDWILYHSAAVVAEAATYPTHWIPNWVVARKSSTTPAGTLSAINTDYKYKQTTTTGVNVSYVTSSSKADGMWEAECIIGSGGKRQVGLVFRYSEAANTGYYACADYNSGDPQIYLYSLKDSSGNPAMDAILDTYDIPQFPSPWVNPGYTFQLRVTYYANKITVWLSQWGNEWVEACSITDATNYAAGRYGLGTNLSDGYWNNCKFSDYVDASPYVSSAGEPTLSIEVNPTTWTQFYKQSSGSATGYLQENTWYTSDNDSNINYFTLTNSGGFDIDVLISSSDNWTGVGKTWTVSPTGEPGNATIGLWAGLEGSGGYYILIKPDDYDVFNFLVENLLSAGTQDFGLLVYTCTSNGGNATMTGQVVLTAVVHT